MLAYFIYNLVSFLLLPLILPLSIILLFVVKKYRVGIWERLGFLPSGAYCGECGRTVFWFHAVSVGEVFASLPLIRECRGKYPDAFILLSTVTAAGNQSARAKCKEADSIIFFPFDFIWIVKGVLNNIRPDIFIFFEKEIWPNFLTVLAKNNIPAVLVNGKLTKRTFSRYKTFGFLWKQVLDNVSYFSVQSEADKKMFLMLGVPVEKIEAAGNMKYEQALENPGVPPDFLLLLEDRPHIFVAGSTHEGEEEEILIAFKMLEGRGITLILAPRHLDRIPQIESLILKAGFRSVRRSKLRQKDDLTGCQIILLDTIGELNGTYKAADLIFIGGSLVPVGGHNILEAAAWGKPVMFGPYMENFAGIAEDFLREEAAVMVKNARDIIKESERLLGNNDLLEKMGKNARRLLENNQGALKRTVRIIENQLHQEER